MKRVLVLYRRGRGPLRKTIIDHVFSFARYGEEVEVHTVDFFTRLPLWIRFFQWDGIILHYSLLAERLNPPLWKHLFKALLPLKNMQGAKIALPQDEYAQTADLWELFRAVGVDTVFTCGNKSEYDKLYPIEKCGVKNRFTTLTGFVDEETLSEIETLKKEGIEREIDIGYRARKLPYWVGRHGQLKWEIGELFAAKLEKTPLTFDISTDDKDVFLGKEWTRFLLRCKAMIGCLGGSSLLDPDGTIRQKVDAYVAYSPKATFEEVEKACFENLDGNLSLFALSPRHFECAMTKTTQVLVEGDYGGVFEAGRHFIELKKDFSNLDQVIATLQDEKRCAEIAENAYRDVVLSDKYTYRTFAKEVLGQIPESKRLKPLKLLNFFTYLHKKATPLRLFCFKVWYKLAIHLPYERKKIQKKGV